MENRKGKTKTILLVFIMSALISLSTALCTSFYFRQIIINMHSGTDFSFQVGSIHTTVTIYKDGELISAQYHAGTVTKLGMNMTMAKMTGNATAYNITQYTLNLTYVSIGNKGTLNTDSTNLPAEWNRTIGYQHNAVYNQFNMTATFTGTTGSQTADCIGINFEGPINGNALWGYDSFDEVTGIDSTFTLIFEIQITLT